ncbi:hypothetical protein, conserved [Babesia ovata]|uniref:C3H1-type domain-containing protein n=1 Tax=Babesia ovata TaxID=189622 RepID=A0A2H6KIY2_9APIC|nr:uncharacterized protein BOVATA_044390 [Babesia ovata]GBE62946.1 hypothetical protein, conserved [Babesia ovata]
MSFLHGVLSGVKDDESVTTYDKNNTLNNVLRDLHNNVGKGREAFGQAVSQVEEKIKNVITPIEGIKTSIRQHKEDPSTPEKSIDNQIADWARRARGYIAKVQDAEGALKNIDSALLGKLTPPIKMLLQATKTFEANALDTDLAAVHAEAQAKMMKVIDSVGKKFDGRIKGLQWYLKREIGSLRTMIDDLRNKQLEALKNSLKIGMQDAFQTVVKTIDKLEGSYNTKIVDPLERLRKTSDSFNTKLLDYKYALSTAIYQVDQDMKKFKDIRNLDTFGERFEETVPLLNALKRKNAFTKLTTYFEKLDQEVVKPLKEVMHRIGEGIGRGGQKVNTDVLQSAVNTSKTQLEELLKVVGGTFPSANLDELKSLFGGTFSAPKLDLKAHSASIQPIVTKLQRHVSSSQNISKDEIKPFFEALGNVSQDISKHCEQLVTAVMEKIREKVKEEVQKVASIIINKITECCQLVNDSAEVSLKAVKGFTNSVSSLQILVSDFAKDIDKKLEELKQHVGTNGNKSENSVYKDLVGMRSSIGELSGKVDNVKVNVRLVGKQLDLCMTRAQNMLNEVPKGTENLINELRDDVNKTITEGFGAIQNESKDLYKKRKSEEVQALETIVTAQLDEIQNIITLDSMSGLKGLMNLMETQHQKIYQIPVIREFKDVTENVRDYLNKILLYTSSQSQSHSPQVGHLKQQLDNLLSHLKNSSKDKQYHFDHTFTADLAALNDALSLLTPKQFNGHQHPELLDALAAGAKRLADELGKQYVNRYSGHKTIDFTKLLVDKKDDAPSKISAVKAPVAKAKEKVLTAEGRQLSQVCLTILTTLHNDLNVLYDKCSQSGKWIDEKLCEMNGEEKNPLGVFLQRCGFQVSKNLLSKEGELKLPLNNFAGEHIHKKLKEEVYDAKRNSHLQVCPQKNAKTNFNVMHIVRCIVTHFDEYNRVSHYAYLSSTRHPCNVYEMLGWLSGLWHNDVYAKLKKHCESLIDNEDDTRSVLKLAGAVTYGLPKLSTYSHNLLTTILGTGDERTTYACQFFDNSLNLYYPTNGAQCVDMLFDIFRKLFPVLRFMYKQCGNTASNHGWAYCRYGKVVPPSNWQCNDHPSNESNCRPTSPLMSYLNDCLPGHLPHQLSSVGCTAKCSTCSLKSRGLPCLPPLGFRGFSSSTRTGVEIGYALHDICGENGVFSTFYASLACLLGRPPSRFCDVFSFFCQLTHSWKLTNNSKVFLGPMQQAICDQITSTVACDLELANNFMDSCRNLFESSSHEHHDLEKDLDFSYLIGCEKQNCGALFRPLDHAAYSMFAPRYAAKYLSWLLYVTADIVKFLEELKYAFCGISCYEYGCSPCLNGSCQKGKHGTNQCGCKSMLHCKGVMSVFCQYGLTFSGYPRASRKKCDYFCTLMEKMLKSELLGKFLTAIDTFMFTVRQNFIWTLVALWSLSLLYLLHIVVVRLDVLRIRSHLRSPASHRIAAQSLLAAARVKALANVKYFSP